VKIEQVNGDLLVSISDNGPGVLPEIREHLFQKFVTGRVEGGEVVWDWLSAGWLSKPMRDGSGWIKKSCKAAPFVLPFRRQITNPRLSFDLQSDEPAVGFEHGAGEWQPMPGRVSKIGVLGG